MPASDNLLKLIKYCEGLRLKVYPDTNGLPTVGTGHLVKSQDNLKIGDIITQDQADAFLLADLANAEDWVADYFKDPMLQCELDCLIDQAYNLHSFPALAQHLIKEGKEVYLQKTLLYDKDEKGHTLLGLKRRRQGEVWLFQGQSWVEIEPKMEAINEY